MIATMASLSAETTHNQLKLSRQKELVPPTDTIDLQEPDHAYLLPTLAGSVAGSVAGTLDS